MSAYELIARKRDGMELTAEELTAFVRGVVDGSIADYQATAWLMAAYLRGMTARETLDLTLAMRDSGRCIDLSDLPGGPALDKHSTGGVGDKASLVVVPMLAAAGASILKMSGRGLGFSGGTVDKLESIPGFRTDLSVEAAKAQTRRIGAAFIGQSAEVAPADKILYGLRDVTATIESIPLIASSIMSKKLASGGQRIVLDVKVGQGAFMRTLERAEALARAMVAIGVGAGVPTVAVLTAMEEPLGYAIGNALEVREAIAVLRNAPDPAAAGPASRSTLFRDLCIDLAAEGLEAVGRAHGEEARQLARYQLASGAAARKFAEIAAAQGGPDDCARILESLPTAPITFVVKSTENGAVHGIDAGAIGQLTVWMGAGRAKKSDAIDHAVGINLHCKTGDPVSNDTPLASLYLRAADAPRAEEFASALRAAYRIGSAETAPRAPDSLILAHIP